MPQQSKLLIWPHCIRSNVCFYWVFHLNFRLEDQTPKTSERKKQFCCKWSTWLGKKESVLLKSHLYCNSCNVLLSSLSQMKKRSSSFLHKLWTFVNLVPSEVSSYHVSYTTLLEVFKYDTYGIWYVCSCLKGGGWTIIKNVEKQHLNFCFDWKDRWTVSAIQLPILNMLNWKLMQQQ